jgi:ribosome-binding protein aMBF1 (putative translation factor)
MDQEDIKAWQNRLTAELEAELSKPEPDPNKVAKRRLLMELLMARMRQGLSQEELAAKMASTQSVVARIESGKGNPSLNTLLTMAAALDKQIVLE